MFFCFSLFTVIKNKMKKAETIIGPAGVKGCKGITSPF